MNIKLKNQREWVLKEYLDSTVRELSEKLGISEFLAKLIAIRGLGDENSARDFFQAQDYGFYDPFLLNDMEKATSRILKAISEAQRILIFGDYDVDGISSVALLYSYLKSLGANVCYYIPERISEGYGLNNSATDKFAAAGIQLIITVDTGITACNEAQYIKEKGMDVIITDHHECRGEIPSAAVAVINPKRLDSTYPMKELAGVGVVFKLVCALAGKENLKTVCDNFSDIVSLGTVADVMPIYGENRRIVAHGLKNIADTTCLGLKELLQKANIDSYGAQRKITASTIGFIIAPRINAAGRIGNVNRAVELLITANKEKAAEIAEELCIINRERQAIENEIFEKAVAKILEGYDLENDRVIVLADEGWHQGVIGIVASKITEKYGLPSILITFSGESGKGSARSIPGFNINEAITACSEYLIKSGGHELAAGLSIEKQYLDDFKAAINDYARERISDDTVKGKLYIDCEISPEEVDIPHAEQLAMLEPYGNGNPAPVFMLKNVTINTIIPIGNNKHLKLLLDKGGNSFNAIYFNKTPEEFGFLQGATVDVAFNLEINEFRGARNIQLNIKDIRLSEADTDYINKQAKEYLRAIVSFKTSPLNIPDMQTFRRSFVYLRTAAKDDSSIDIYKAAMQISNSFSLKVTPCMLNIMLDVFSEMGLLEVERQSLNDAKIAVLNVDGKVNLESSRLLIKLRENI